MDRQTVSSTNIASVGYEPVSSILEIEFHSGGVYQYERVSPTLAQNLVNAESPGRFFAENIKDRYPTMKVY